MLSQLGQALPYVGAHGLSYAHPADHRDESRPSSFHSKFENGLHYEVGLEFRVNGKRREQWRFVVVYEPDDTYTIWLFVIRDFKVEVARELRDIYADNLQESVESVYDHAIETRNEGFIPL